MFTWFPATSEFRLGFRVGLLSRWLVFFVPCLDGFKENPKRRAAHFSRSESQKNHSPGGMQHTLPPVKGRQLLRSIFQPTSGPALGPPVVPFLTRFFLGGEGSPTEMGYRKKGTLILASLLEDLGFSTNFRTIGVFFGWFG